MQPPSGPGTARRRTAAWFGLAVVAAAIGLAASTGVPYPQRDKEWSIGMYAGTSLFDLRPRSGVNNPVLTASDIPGGEAAYVADPFLIRDGDTSHLFFEVLERSTGRGSIGRASSTDGRTWRFQRIVLREPFHLSYPYVFRDGSQVFMVPECQSTNSVRLYRADPFPDRWVLAGVLLAGVSLADPSVVRRDGRWWLFASAGHYRDGTLRLYWADELAGPWHEHPQSPVLKGAPHAARPGGRILVRENRLIRIAQDDAPDYGAAVRAFEVMELTTTAYRERPLGEGPLLAAGHGWTAAGMHHLDAHWENDGSVFAAVDGHRFRWRLAWWRGW